jgi:serine/threonine-protein kinase
VAEALFQEGRRLSAEQRYAEACPKFAESQRLEPAIGTLLNLATCHVAEGKTASAWSEFTRALGEAQRNNRQDVIELAQARLAELEPKLSRLVVEVAPERELPGLEVRLDGQLLSKPAWGIAAPIDPGKHTLGATAPGYTEWTIEVVLGPTEQQSLTIPALVPAPPVAAPVETAPISAPPAPVAEKAPAKSWPAQKSWALGVAGAGVVGIGASIALGFAAKSTFDRSASHCDDTGCDPDGMQLRHDAVVRGRVATVVFGVGAVALAGGAVLWFTAPRSADKPAWSVGITPRTVVARLAWR